MTPQPSSRIHNPAGDYTTDGTGYLRAKYRALFDAIDEGFCIVEMIFDALRVPVDYRFLEMNAAFEHHTGLKDAIGKTARELVPNLERFWFETYGKVALTGESNRFENGSVPMGRMFDVFAFRIGEPDECRVAILFTDITERKRTEEALRTSEERQSYLLKLSDTLRTLTDATEIQYAAAHILGEHLHANRVGYAEDLGDGETIEVTRNYIDGVADLKGVYRYRDYGSKLLEDFLAGQTVVRPDIAQDPSLTDDEKRAHAVLDLGATFNIPLVRDGTLIAVMFAHHKTAHDWTDEEALLMRETAERTWAAVERARAEARLREAEARTRLLQQLTARLSQSVTVEQVGQAVLEESVNLIGATSGAVNLLLDEETFVITSSFGSKLREDEREKWSRFPNSPALVGGAVVRSGETLWFETGKALATEFPAMATLAERFPGTCITLPLMTDAKAIGVLFFAYPEVRKYNHAEYDFLQALARLCAQAIWRAQLYEAEHKARQEAEEANALKMKFLGMVSHELRTPLASIKGFSSTLLASDVEFAPEKQRQFLGIIDHEADRLTGLVEQLLDLSRLNAGSLQIDLVPLALDDLLHEALPQLSVLTQQHRLEIALPPALPKLHADPHRLSQVVTNVVGNAAKYSPAGTPIRIGACAEGGFVQIDVSDQGIGIPPDERATVFEAFRQSKRKDPNQRVGAGLGLAICKSIVELHNGRIWIQDQATGTTLSFTIPISTPPPSPLPTSQAP
jgi:signal transduction histidine kinase/PAS domain-containing protein